MLQKFFGHRKDKEFDKERTWGYVYNNWDIFNNCSANNMKEAGNLSKKTDLRIGATFELVNMLCQKWDKISIDWFASDKNNKCSRFSSKFLCPNAETVNEFSSDWSKENSLLIPAIFLIPKAIKHFLVSELSSRASLVSPYWVSATLWSILL